MRVGNLTRVLSLRNLRFFIAVKIPYFCPLCLCFSNSGSRLITGCERFISGSPLPSLSATYTWFIVFKVLRLSHRTFSLPAFIPICRPVKGAVQLEANGRRVTAAIPESREVGGYQLSDLRRHASAHSYTDLPVCQSQTNVPSLLAVGTSICDFDTLCSAFRTRVTH